MSCVTIRAAGPADAETVHRFVCALAEYEREPDAVEVSPHTLRRQLGAAPPPFECLVAEVDGRPVGFALFFQTYSTWRGRPGLHLEDLFVEEAHRRHGVGRALFTRVAQLAVERGYGRVEWAVLDWNASAMRFYERLGGAPLAGWGTWRLGDEALVDLGRD
jgi:GNAT superfamily N-acetyltransferase